MKTTTDVAVTELHDLDDHHAACDLFAKIWGRSDGGSLVPPEVVRAISHAGGYVAGARNEDGLFAASVGFIGLHDGELILHSHITGIDPAVQGRGVGTALKHHQRAWAGERGIAAITWTYDPLVRRNGRFNLHRLGAEAVAYLPDFYGLMQDSQNGLDPTDRCFVRWDVHKDRAPLEADPARLIAGGAEMVLRASDDGAPAVTKSHAAVRLCWVPDDIVAIRRADPATATAWRQALRAVMVDAMRDGLRGVAMSRDGCYVLASGAFPQ